MTHQNRSKRTDAPGRSPSPEQIRAARERAGLDEAAAAKLCYSTASQWTRWELGEMNGGARMHPGIWAYWRSRVENPAHAAFDAARKYIVTTAPLLDDRGIIYKRLASDALALIDAADDRTQKS